MVASGTLDEVRDGFEGLGLEAGFMQITEQTDAERMAQHILAAVLA